ncbi:MAG: dihydropteroate synthase [Gemmatimonadaceae bacterium]
MGSSERHAVGWLRRAVSLLKLQGGLRIRAVSAIYESDAMLPEGAPESWKVPYLNLALACETRQNLSPLEVLAQLKHLERVLGRQQRTRWAPREIDIDILAWDGVELDTNDLALPHRGLLERPFALLPLAEVHPDWAASRPDAATLIRRWRLAPLSEVPFRTRRTLHRLTELMAVLNLTPDSFSDGGRFEGGGGNGEISEAAVEKAARAAVELGATVLDLGAESTRPGATPVHPAEEWRRLAPGLRAVSALRDGVTENACAVKISIDSRNPETIARALETGIVDWINDVTGFDSAAMRDVARVATGTSVVLMHSLGVPPDRLVTLRTGEDPVMAILDWGKNKLAELGRAGIDPQRVILDPGIGFGKTPEQNLALLRGAARLHEIGARLLIGHSRKSFMAHFESPGLHAPSDRELETALISTRLADQGIEYLRVHDIAFQKRALRLSAAWEGVARW